MTMPRRFPVAGRLRPLTGVVLALVMTGALSGCLGLGGSKPPPTLLRLTPAATLPGGAVLAGRAQDALIVLTPETDRALGVARIAVQVDPTNVAYLAKAQWAERPANMFAALLVETIRAKNQRLVFAADDALAAGDNRLGGRLSAFTYDPADQSVLVRFDAVRTAAGGALSTRRFEARIAGVAATPQAVGAALNSAANQVAAEVAAWVG